MSRSWWTRGRWAQSRKPTAAEHDVIRRLLKGDDSRLAEFLRQLTEAPGVKRRTAGKSGYTLELLSVSEALLVEMDETVWSDRITLLDRQSGRPLRFRVELMGAGLLGTLEGSTDGDWPSEWEPDPNSWPEDSKLFVDLKPSWNSQPDRRGPGAAGLAEVLGAPFAELPPDVLIVHPPAGLDESPTEEQLTELPERLRQILAASNGFELMSPERGLRWAEVFPVRDFYSIKLPVNGNEADAIVFGQTYENGHLALVAEGGSGGEVYSSQGAALGPLREFLGRCASGVPRD